MTNKEKNAVLKWKGISQVAVGDAFAAGLNNKGKPVFTGTLKNSGKLSNWSNIIQISAGNEHLVALKADGKVVAAGPNDGRTAVSGWRDIIKVSAAGNYTLGLKRDGTVLLADASKSPYFSSGVSSWTGIVDIAAASNTLCFALRGDGSLVTASTAKFNTDDLNQRRDIVAIAFKTGQRSLQALSADGTLRLLQNNSQTLSLGPPEAIKEQTHFVFAAYSSAGIIGQSLDGKTHTNIFNLRNFQLPALPK